MLIFRSWKQMLPELHSLRAALAGVKTGVIALYQDETRPRISMTELRVLRPAILDLILNHPGRVILFGTDVVRLVTGDNDASVHKFRNRPVPMPFEDPDRTAPAPYRIRATVGPEGIEGSDVRLWAQDLHRDYSVIEERPTKALPVGTKVLSIDTEYAPGATQLLTMALATPTTIVGTDVAYGDPQQLRDHLNAAEVLVAHHAPDDLAQLVELGVPLKPGWVDGSALIDTLLCAKMHDENHERYGLEPLLLEYVPAAPWKHKTVESYSAHDATTWPADLRLDRCLTDAWAAARLAKAVYRPGPLSTFTHAVALTLARMTLAGAVIDRSALSRLGGEYQSLMGDAMNKLRTIATSYGIPDFTGTDTQVRTLLYDKLGLPPGRTTATGLASVDKATLINLEHPLAQLLVAYNSAEKLYSTNVVGLEELITPLGADRGWLPFNFRMLGARTGRRTTADPNSQNWAPAIRTLVVPRRTGGTILSADFNKLEVVLIAWRAGDSRLLNDFLHNGGYIAVAKNLLGFDVDKKHPAYRAVKAIVLGTHYGMGPNLMATNLWNLRNEDGTPATRFHTTPARHAVEVARLQTKYLDTYPGLRMYMDRQREAVMEKGRVVSATGRVRHLPVHDARASYVGHYLNAGINAPVQGDAADVAGAALVDAERALCAEAGISLVEWHTWLVTARKRLREGHNLDILYASGPDMSYLFNEVHDALVMDMHPDPTIAARHREILVETMKTVPSFKKLVPSFPTDILGVDVDVNTHWQ